MTQQQKQKQRTRSKQAPRTVGEIVIATLDLLLGLPLAVFLIMVLTPDHLPGDPANWLIIGSWILLAFALISAGLSILLRQRSLARVFQWLAALGGLGTLGWLVYQFWQAPPTELTSILILYLSGIFLAAIGLILLPFWLRKMGEDE
jgi:hypothetical protein